MEGIEIRQLTGKEIMDETIALARKVADICLASPLRSLGAVDAAISIARDMLRANSDESKTI